GVPRVDRRTVDMRSRQVEVAEGYDRARFHGLHGRYHNWRLRRVLKKVLRTLGPNDLVLDLPCGTGRVLDYLAPRHRTIAADISNEMLTVARRKAEGTASPPVFLVADARHIPLPSASVDVVFSIRFLHLLDRATRLR